MINVDFSQQDIQAIAHLRYHHHHPRVQRKMEALWLKFQGYPHNEICRITGISHNTLCSYFRAFQLGGVEKLKKINFYMPTSELEQHREKLEIYFRAHPPTSIKEAMAKIEELTGIKRSESTIGKFMTLMGMRPRKVGSIPSKADPEKQADFKKNELDPILEEAKRGERAVFFVDAAHFVLAPFLGFLWSFARIFIKAPAGRKRFNVLGALNAITHEFVLITNDTYINSESVCALLQKIALLHIQVPITLVLDNACYQKCKIVFELANKLNIDLLYLPSYSPNLNLIERLWKFVKKKVLYSKYYSDFHGFKSAISGCLSETHTTHKKELDSLLTLKFQTFNKCHIMNI